jgi:diguanylate cyclase (GGDEF)-like protein
VSSQPVSPSVERSRRGRILMVGSEASSASPWGGEQGRRTIGDQLGRVTLHAENIFDAIGQLVTAPSREPIELLLLGADAMSHVSQRAIAALRQLDPSVCLVLVAKPGEHEAVAQAFDHVIPPPLHAQSLAALLDEPFDDSPAHAVTAPEPASVQAASPPPVTDSEPLQSQPPFQPTDTTAAVHHEQALGDTDLVEAILHGIGDVASLATAMILQQTGWDEVAFEPDDGGSQGHAVRHEHELFGYLVAPDAPEAGLAQWADWMARWLALDAAHRGFQHMAYHDELTGAWNRRYFNAFLADAMAAAAKRRRPVTVMVLDIDDFKVYNDNFGHAAGDDILRETARLLKSVIRQGDRVCRIGGDEFAVVFADIDGPREPGSMHPETVEQIARRFQDQICTMRFPKLGQDAPATLSVSAGLATYPWDGSDADSLLDHADQLALQSKRRGKNAITLGPGAQHVCSQRKPNES